jgi:hypothetical protein
VLNEFSPWALQAHRAEVLKFVDVPEGDRSEDGGGSCVVAGASAATITAQRALGTITVTARTRKALG